MDEKPQAERELSEAAEGRKRQPWHAPQFVITDVAATDVQGNGGNDGGPIGSAS